MDAGVQMIYNKIHKDIFKNHPQRFISEVEIDGKVEVCHVKNTGRFRELLVPGATVYANYTDNLSRATKYDLIAVRKIKPEAKYGASRFDFYVETAGRL